MTLDRFETAQLRGERLSVAHLPEIRRLHSDAAVMALLGGVRSEAATADYLDRNLAHWKQYGHGIYILRDRAHDAVVGLGCLRHLSLDHQDEIEIGYLFSPSYWGRGLGTEVARACIELGFGQLDAPSLVAITHPDNRASRRVMEKAGMQFERDAQLDDQPIVVYRIWQGDVR